MVLFDIHDYDYLELPDDFNREHSPKDVSDNTFFVFLCCPGKAFGKQYINMLSYYEKFNLRSFWDDTQVTPKQTFCAEH